MGNYREQYERYYGGINKKSRRESYKSKRYNYSKDNNKGNDNDILVERWTKKILWQTLGALILICFIIVIKVIPLETSKEVYNKSKELMDEKVDVSETLMNIDIPNGQEYKERILDYIDKVKSVVNKDKTLKEKIKDDYIVPVNGNLYEKEGSNEGIDILTEEEKEVFAVYDGVVEEVSSDGEDKNIIINHDNGVKSYYGLLSNIDVNLGDKVEKGQKIGKTGTLISKDKKGILFKFIYMGSDKNPEELMDLSSLKKV